MLTQESKELIRKYMVSLVALPLSIASIGGVVLGWFANEGIKGSAYAEAYGEAQATILSVASAASRSAANSVNAEKSAKEASEELEKSIAEVDAILEEAELYQAKLETVKSVEQGLADKVAESLLKSPQSLTKAMGGEVESRLSAVEEKTTSIVNATNVTIYQCPSGTGGWNPGGQWASYGCQGQISSLPTCQNIEYPNRQNRECKEIGRLKLF